MKKVMYTILLIGLLGLVGCSDLFSNNDSNAENVVANDESSQEDSNSNEMEDGNENENENNSAETDASNPDGEVIVEDGRSDYKHYYKNGLNLTIPDPIIDSGIPILDDINVFHTSESDEETRALIGMTIIQYEYYGSFEDAVKIYKDYFDNEDFDEVLRNEDNEIDLGVYHSEELGGRGFSRGGNRGDVEYAAAVREEPDNDFILVEVRYHNPPAD